MIKIYGKENCGYCVAAKNLLDSKGLPYEYLQLGVDFTTEELKEVAPQAASFPQIFMDGNLIGGFDQLRIKVGLLEYMGVKPGVLLG
jgi:glutaredoxin